MTLSEMRRILDEGAGFRLDTDSGALVARALVIATGGLSIPKAGATDFGYRIANVVDGAVGICAQNKLDAGG